MKQEKETKELSMEQIEKTIQEGTFREKMGLLENYYAHKSYNKELPYSQGLLNRIRAAALQDIREGCSCIEGMDFKSKEPLSEKEQQKRVENFYKWEIAISLASQYADNIRPQVEIYRAKLFSLRALLEEYQALRTAEALAEGLLATGESAESIEDRIAKKLLFSEGNSPYTIRLDNEGNPVALLLNHETARDIEIQIRETAEQLNKHLRGYKGSAEAFLTYFEEIGMADFKNGALRFMAQWRDMVFSPSDIIVNGAYLGGTIPHKESLFPDILTYYADIKIPKKEQDSFNKIIRISVEELWKKRSS